MLECTVLAAMLVCVSPVDDATAQQIGPYHVLGNPTATQRTATDTAITPAMLPGAINPSGDVTGSTDSAAIAAAQAAAVTNKATSVTLNSGNWYISSTIAGQGGICINGKGNSFPGAGFPTGGTIINLVANVPAYKVSGTVTAITGWCINNLSIVLPASGTSATGITLDAAQYGLSTNVTIFVSGPSQTGFLSNPAAGHANTAWNTITNLVVYSDGAATSATGVKLTGVSSGPNSFSNVFVNANIISTLASQTALWLAASDTNTFYNLTMYGNANVAWTAIKFDYSVNAAWPAQTYFYGLEYGYNNAAGTSAVVNAGSPSGGLAANIIFGLGTTNGTSVPNLTNLYVVGTNVGLSFPAGTFGPGGLGGTNGALAINLGAGKNFEIAVNNIDMLRLYGASGGVTLGALGDPGANSLLALGYLQSGVAGSATGHVVIAGATSQSVTQTVQTIAGNATVTWGTGSGTPAVTAGSPLAITAATGNIACSTCVTSSGGGAISGTAPITVSAAGVVALATQAQNTALGNISTSTAAPTAIPIREKLSAARTYYVRVDGNDSNCTGLTDAAYVSGTYPQSCGFLTIQKPYDVVTSALDLAGQTLTIQIRDGTYSPASGTDVLSITQPWTGGGAVMVLGNSGTPANVVFNATNAQGVRIQTNLPGILYLRNFKIVTTAGHGILLQGIAAVYYQGINFGAVGAYHLFANTPGAQFFVDGNYTISGAPGAGAHWAVTAPSQIFASSLTITLTGTPNFSGAFALAQAGGTIWVPSVTFSGSATGSRYSASENGVIHVSGGGATYLPGNAAGTATTGGQYNFLLERDLHPANDNTPMWLNKVA